MVADARVMAFSIASAWLVSDLDDSISVVGHAVDLLDYIAFPAVTRGTARGGGIGGSFFVRNPPTPAPPMLASGATPGFTAPNEIEIKIWGVDTCWLGSRT
jgi:hypothetical protein